MLAQSSPAKQLLSRLTCLQSAPALPAAGSLLAHGCLGHVHVAAAAVAAALACLCLRAAGPWCVCETADVKVQASATGCRSYFLLGHDPH